MLSRRTLLTTASIMVCLPAAAGDPADQFGREVATLERNRGGRLGIAVLDTAGGGIAQYRGHERFPLCSTYKCLAAALVLARVDRDEDSLGRRVGYRRNDLVPYSPITKTHADGDGMTLDALCDAAMTVSDNTAANLLLDSFGGPPRLTAYLRSLGDTVTRLDRAEPELNEATPGDPRDTTTPVAMLELLRQIVCGTALSEASRARLTGWMVRCKTGDKRLRAGVPADWRVGDKTGTGEHGVTNDVAVMWPVGRAPLIVTAFYADGPGSEETRSEVLAEVGRLVAADYRSG